MAAPGRGCPARRQSDRPSTSGPPTPSNGTSVDLEDYGLGTTISWHWVGFFLGLGWLLYWIVPKPTVTRLAVTSQIPMNTDGRNIGLITNRDHRSMNVFAIITVLPVKIPQQVVRAEVPPATLPDFADAQVTRAAYTPSTATLVMDVNVGKTPSCAA